MHVESSSWNRWKKTVPELLWLKNALESIGWDINLSYTFNTNKWSWRHQSVSFPRTNLNTCQIGNLHSKSLKQRFKLQCMFWHSEINDVFDMILMIAFHTPRNREIRTHREKEWKIEREKERGSNGERKRSREWLSEILVARNANRTETNVTNSIETRHDSQLNMHYFNRLCKQIPH